MTNSTHYGIDARIRTQATLVGVSTLKTSPKSNLPVHTYPTCIRIHSSTQDSSGNIGNRAHIVKCAKFASCSALREPGNEVAILNTVFTVKNSPSGLDLFTSPEKKISGSIQRPHNFGLIAYSNISTMESRFVCPIYQIRVDGSCIRKEKVADSKISGYIKGLSGSAISGSLRESQDCTILSFFY